MCRSRAARRQDLLNISPIVTDAAAAVVDDSFLRCFQGAPPDPWNWNVYLFPTWCLGCLIRFGILFPLRCGSCTSICLLPAVARHNRTSIADSLVSKTPTPLRLLSQEHRRHSPRDSCHCLAPLNHRLLATCRLIMLLLGFLLFFIAFFGTRAVLKVGPAHHSLFEHLAPLTAADCSRQ
jgi:hypothetical protein